MPPPMTKELTRSSRLVNTPSLSFTFAPPIAQTNGCLGSWVSAASASSSAAIRKPATAGR